VVSDRVVASFEIRSTRYVGPDGSPVGTLPDWASDREAMVELYRAMALTRAFDQRAVALQRSGQLGTFASSLGQEAVAVGVAAAMDDRDVLVPSFREQGAQLWRGVTMIELLLYWGGDERGSDFAGPREDFPVAVPVGSNASHAAGLAMAFQLRDEPRVAVCVIGDGATSKGDVYEAVNFAGVRRLPVVFVINNNQWAISMPRSGQTAAGTLAQKAIAAGVDGEQVDGNDVVAVRAGVGAAVAGARAGDGPTVIEAVTYRLTDHTTADDASRYREEAEVSARWEHEPLSRIRTLLVDRGWWGRDDEEKLLVGARDQVEAAVREYLAVEPVPAVAMFDHLYASLPPSLRAQRDEVAGRFPGAAVGDHG
jgi:2-oxoisovalerate dehydrogenase E1 component subunit alpha